MIKSHLPIWAAEQARSSGGNSTGILGWVTIGGSGTRWWSTIRANNIKFSQGSRGIFSNQRRFLILAAEISASWIRGWKRERLEDPGIYTYISYVMCHMYDHIRIYIFNTPSFLASSSSTILPDESLHGPQGVRIIIGVHFARFTTLTTRGPVFVLLITLGQANHRHHRISKP